MIYTITGVVDPFEKNIATRLFGYAHEFEEAKEMVMENYCDIFEHTYRYAVVEPVKWGIHPLTLPHEQTWFQYNFQTESYDKIDFVLENQINIHGIG